MQENQIVRLRIERGWSQQQLIRQLIAVARMRNLALPEAPGLRVTVSGWENGRHRPTAMYRELLALALEVSEAELGLGVHATPSPLVVGPELVDYLSSTFALHARADQNLGSQLLVDVVTEQTKRAEGWALNACGRDRSALLWIVGRYAEFCGWLHQDQGDFTQADHWTVRAIEISQELGDPRLVAYGLTRRSNIATEGQQPSAGLRLAEAALRQPTELNPSVVALAQRQVAVSSAMLGDRRGCVNAVELGAQAVGTCSEVTPESDYCTASYIAMEGAHALSISGRLRDSVQMFEH
ncbi:helix-turn-helix domain-containing protein, partial [Microlunatus ginsengisoli]